jgi:hypothetical protein
MDLCALITKSQRRGQFESTTNISRVRMTHVKRSTRLEAAGIIFIFRPGRYNMSARLALKIRVEHCVDNINLIIDMRKCTLSL